MLATSDLWFRYQNEPVLKGHLPQVAGCGHQHFFVSKETDGAMTETHMQPLDKRARLQELARLLGGSEVTRNTLANAKELLAA